MDREIIRRWNERVKPRDTVIHLGDFMFSGSAKAGNQKKPDYYLDQLNGRIVHVKGNHDRNNGLKSHIDSLQIALAGTGWWVQHKPEYLTWTYNLVGHVHNNWKIQTTPRYIAVNLSVEVWNYYPANIQEILGRIPAIRRPSVF